MDFAVALVAASAVPGPEAAAAAMLFLAGSSCLATMRHMGRRKPLRCCPLCMADAVSAAEYETVDGLQIRVQLRCGQCGVWRRIVTGPAIVARQQRNLEAERMRITRRLQRLELGRASADTEAFADT